MTAGAYATKDQAKDFVDHGLVLGHAYSLIEAVEVTDGNDQIQKLVKLRNPWGKHEWNGDWSDSSPLWTD